MRLAETSIEDLGDIFRMGICPSYESGSIRDEICKWAIRGKSLFRSSSLPQAGGRVTIGRRVAAIRYAHKLAGQADRTKTAPYHIVGLRACCASQQIWVLDFRDGS
jgi:hypothetical protein